MLFRSDNSTQETISIPVVQIDRFQVTGVDAPAEAYLGEENYLTVNFVNKGRSDVYNLSAEISGDIQNPGQQQNLGNLTSGSTGSAEFTRPGRSSTTSRPGRSTSSSAPTSCCKRTSASKTWAFWWWTRSSASA